MSSLQYSLYIAFTVSFGVAALLFLVAMVQAIGDTVLAASPGGAEGRRGFWNPFPLQVGALGVSILTFLLTIAWLTVRGVETGQMPIQSKFETFGIVLFGIALGYVIINLAMRMWGHRGAAAIFSDGVGLFTMLLGVIFAILALTHEDWEALYRPPALKSVWMAPHVATLIFGYGALLVAFAGAVVCIIVTWITGRTNAGDIDWDSFLHRTMMVGFPFLTAGLFMGSVWGQEAWSVYWGWDIKETWALITWLVFLVYFHLRYEREFKGSAAAWVIVIGSAAILLTWLGMSLLPDSISSMHVYN